MPSWIDREVAGCPFADGRLAKRFRTFLEQLSERVGGPIPSACGDGAATEAADRFLDNGRVSEAEVLAGHFRATGSRFAAADGPILVRHDTTRRSSHSSERARTPWA